RQATTCPTVSFNASEVVWGLLAVVVTRDHAPWWLEMQGPVGPECPPLYPVRTPPCPHSRNTAMPQVMALRWHSDHTAMAQWSHPKRHSGEHAKDPAYRRRRHPDRLLPRHPCLLHPRAEY